MTDWKPTMLTASAPSGEMMTWINPSAIEQLQREVDALKVKAAPTSEPSAELVALRARCERLAAVVRAVSTALAPYDLHTIYTSQTPRITNAEASRIGDAIDALHPGDTEEAK